MAAKGTLFQKFRDDLLRPRCIEPYLAPAGAVPLIRKQFVQRHYKIAARQIGGNMIRIGDAHIRRGIRSDVGNHVIIDLAVIRIQTQIHGDIRIKIFKILNRFLIDGRLVLIGVIFGPESDFIFSGKIELFRHGKAAHPLAAVTAGEQNRTAQHKRRRTHSVHSVSVCFPRQTAYSVSVWLHQQIVYSTSASFLKQTSHKSSFHSDIHSLCKLIFFANLLLHPPQRRHS